MFPATLWTGVQLLLIAAAMASPQAALSPGGSRPNILLVVIDDVGNDMLGVYDEGVPEDQPPTPHMDALATRGVRFTNAYSNPMCSPTRAALMTGRHAFRTGIGWIIRLGSPVHLPFEEITIPEVLRTDGKYTSVHLGKWHLGNAFNFIDPVLHGWDLFAGTKRNIGDYSRYQKAISIQPGTSAQFNHDVYVTTDTTDDAVALLDVLPEPWFLWVAYHAPHDPLHEPPPQLHTQPLPLTTDLQKYKAMVEALDSEVGRLISKVDSTDTVIMLAGDNGTAPGITASSPQFRAKSTLYEAGVNVPLIVMGAPAVPTSAEGSVCAALVSLLDVYATVVELAGVSLERVLTPGYPLDSVSFRELLRDPAAHTREWVYAEKLNPVSGPPYDRANQRMIRDKQWKYVRNVRNRNRDRFHDLSTAPPHADGPNLLDGVLTPDQEQALSRLMVLMNDLGPDLPSR